MSIITRFFRWSFLLCRCTVFHITKIEKTYELIFVHFNLFCSCKISNFLLMNVLFFDEIQNIRIDFDILSMILIFIHFSNDKLIILKIEHSIFDVFLIIICNFFIIVSFLYIVISLKSVVFMNFFDFNTVLTFMIWLEVIAKWLFLNEVIKQFFSSKSRKYSILKFLKMIYDLFEIFLICTAIKLRLVTWTKYFFFSILACALFLKKNYNYDFLKFARF